MLLGWVVYELGRSSIRGASFTSEVGSAALAGSGEGAVASWSLQGALLLVGAAVLLAAAGASLAARPARRVGLGLAVLAALAAGYAVRWYRLPSAALEGLVVAALVAVACALAAPRRPAAADGS